ASGLSHLLTNWHSQVPTIGASGAIAGVMGAYLLLFPGSKILTLIPIFFIPYFIEVPAFVFLGLWFLLQFLSAAGSHGQSGGIAWWAHIGGFLFGMVFLKMFQKVPRFGLTRKLRPATSKRGSPRLQVIRPEGAATDPHLYGTLSITSREARFGARKLINIPWGYRKGVFRVTVPPGIQDGATLRLSGMGRETAPGLRGNLYLRVMIRP
ncbi:MAG: rhomboid family intramembrane serine protease, partial [Deltaproteobacteria bacterium]|nr:rhomboid family intramembrane serine protease [Deltaproteobacteria bacterium]